MHTGLAIVVKHYRIRNSFLVLTLRHHPVIFVILGHEHRHARVAQLIKKGARIGNGLLQVDVLQLVEHADSTILVVVLEAERFVGSRQPCIMVPIAKIGHRLQRL